MRPRLTCDALIGTEAEFHEKHHRRGRFHSSMVTFRCSAVLGRVEHKWKEAQTLFDPLLFERRNCFCANRNGFRTGEESASFCTKRNAAPRD